MVLRPGDAQAVSHTQAPHGQRAAAPVVQPLHGDAVVDRRFVASRFAICCGRANQGIGACVQARAGALPDHDLHLQVAARRVGLRVTGRTQ